MNETRRELLILQAVRMASACVKVAPLARFYIAQAKRLSAPPLSRPRGIPVRAALVGGRAWGGRS